MVYIAQKNPNKLNIVVIKFIDSLEKLWTIINRTWIIIILTFFWTNFGQVSRNYGLTNRNRDHWLTSVSSRSLANKRIFEIIG